MSTGRGTAPIRRYRVVWEIDVAAVSPLEAAKEALAIQRDTENIATCYEVQDREDDPVIRVFDIDLTHDTCTERRIKP